jgi:hypothetical protein
MISTLIERGTTQHLVPAPISRTQLRNLSEYSGETRRIPFPYSRRSTYRIRHHKYIIFIDGNRISCYHWIFDLGCDPFVIRCDVCHKESSAIGAFTGVRVSPRIPRSTFRPRLPMSKSSLVRLVFYSPSRLVLPVARLSHQYKSRVLVL